MDSVFFPILYFILGIIIGFIFNIYIYKIPLGIPFDKGQNVYPYVILLNGFIWLLTCFRLGISVYSFLICLTLTCLLAIAVIDFKHMTIPDGLVLLIFILALINLLFNRALPFLDYIIGFFIISVPFFIIAHLKGGMGGGDIKLMAVCGLLLGYKLIILSLLIGSIVGTAYSILMMIKHKSGLKTKVPFAPFLAIGLFISALYGNMIIMWYFYYVLGLYYF